MGLQQPVHVLLELSSARSTELARVVPIDGGSPADPGGERIVDGPARRQVQHPSLLCCERLGNQGHREFPVRVAPGGQVVEHRRRRLERPVEKVAEHDQPLICMLLGAVPMEDMDLVVSPGRREVTVDPASPNLPVARVK